MGDILYSKEGGIARVVLNRPERRNALRGQTMGELLAAFKDAADDNSIGVVVFTGAGDKAFCSGGDIKEQSQGPMKGPSLVEFFTAMRNSGKPILAAVNGDCLGAGLELMLFCDLAIAAEHARFGRTGLTTGLSPVLGVTQLLPRLIGERRAREMVYLDRFYSAGEAQALGLVNKVVPFEKLEGEVDQWCREILARPPLALKVAKAFFNSEGDQLYPSLVQGELILHHLLIPSPERQEGMKAFLEKRPPDYEQFRR